MGDDTREMIFGVWREDIMIARLGVVFNVFLIFIDHDFVQ
jgi:hypothetical protein